MAWSKVINGKMRFDLHPGQSAIFRSKARYRAAIAGTGGGKTAIGPLYCLEECQRTVRERNMNLEPIIGMIVAPTHPVMARATSVEMCRVFNQSPFKGRYVESRNYYLLPNGLGKIWMLSADRPDGMEGGQVDFAWMDEAGQMKYRAWEAIQGRVGLRHAPILITTTPYDMGWLKKKFCDRADAGDPEYYYSQWSSITNPAYPKASYDSAKATMSEARFLMRYHGKFVVPRGMVYPDFQNCVKPFNEKDVRSGVLVGGMDWGWDPDPRATIAAVLTGPVVPGTKNHLWVFFERYVRHETTHSHARKVPHHTRYYVDSSGGEEVAILRRARHVVRKNKVPSIIIGQDAVTKRLRMGTITIHPDLIHLIEESEEYTWPVVDDEVVGGNPEGKCHALDALRYMIANVDRWQNARAA